MRRLTLGMLGVLVMVLAGCGGGSSTPTPTPQPNSGLTGTYNGEIVIGNSSPFVSVTTTFTVDSAGKVAGTTTGTQSSGTPGEKGTLSGTVTGTNTASLDFNLTFDSPTLKKYTGTGKGQYADLNKSLSGLLTGKDAGGTFVGDFIITSAKE
jgi:hypothetical protein